MSGRLRVAVCWALFLCLLVPAVGALGVYPSFKFKVYDHTGVRGAVIDGVGCEVTGHKMHAYISDLYPGNLKVGVKWSSSKSSVASVNSKGVITSKKQGMARIYAKVTDRKTGDWRKSSFSVLILRNATIKTGMPSGISQAGKDLKSVVGSLCEAYVKNGDIYLSMYVYNGSTSVLKNSVNFEISYWPEFGSGVRMEDSIDLGVRKAKLVSNIAPNMVGKTKAFKIGKPGGFKANKDYLLDAFILATRKSGKATGSGDLSALVRRLSAGNPGLIAPPSVMPTARSILATGARSVEPPSVAFVR